ITHSVSAATTTELRKGKLGESGALLFTLSGMSGSIKVSADQAADIQAGNTYLTIQSAAFATGEVRAQVLGLSASAMGSGTTRFSAVLTGLQQVPPIISLGSGKADLTLDESTGELSYNISQSL